MIVGVNDFVRRQVNGSGKTYSKTLSFEEIASHAHTQMENGKFSAGYRDGVRIVQVDKSFLSEFICPYVKLSMDTKLVSKIVKRRTDEEPYIQICAIDGSLLKAGAVDLILYRHDVLNENNEQSTDCEWELISINAIPEGVNKLPIGPITMMRNQLELTGGTKAFYSSEEWAESVRFWQQYVVLDPKNENR